MVEILSRNEYQLRYTRGNSCVKGRKDTDSAQNFSEKKEETNM
jgi:hypothetical protein